MLHGLKSFSLPEIEEKVLKFWKEKKIFEKSLKKNSKSDKLKTKSFVFYEGPPSANARPGIHHVLARVFKDVIPRYKTMRGFHVPRKSGWDTHGLPIELAVEKELGLKSKKEIEKYGIAEFNKKCRELVWKYKDEWEKLTERIGFWLDLKNPYITYDNKYIESLWAIFKEVWDKKLLYKGHKVVPWCTRCGTALSSHELALGYKEIQDQSVYIKFRVKSDKPEWKNAYILSWTTTPWTLPGNVALAIGADMNYVKVKINNDFFILAKDRLGVLGKPDEIIKEFKGKKLIGLSYEPLFEVKPPKRENAYKVYPADFVTTTDGTGVVHTAVMYGEDDYNLGKKFGLPQFHAVDEQGEFREEAGEFAGMYVKAKETEEKIIEHLMKNGNLLRTEKYTHEYPFCWRCETPLLYYARDSWFIAMSKLRKKLIAANKKINWIPEHLREGRFGEWLKEVKDWAISRERYWGTPLPIWQCDPADGGCGFREVIGNVKDLRARSVGRNKYFFVRHGEADHNLAQICGSHKDTPQLTSRLTEKGKAQATRSAKKIKKEKIDLIISSPLIRARETAEIIKKETGAEIKYDDRLVDINPGIFYGRPIGEHHKFFKTELDKFEIPPPEGESRNDVKSRMWGFMRAIDENYSGKKVLIVGHGDPLWILRGTLEGLADREILTLDFPETGGIYPINATPLPLNDAGDLDLHRPYIDRIKIECGKCGRLISRTPEVADVWFDSGAMPFAQAHWPFEKKIDFPADYISEGIDQTRGWFYTLLAVAVLLGESTPYKNVISLGLILDKHGQKMSKSKGNVVDPWTIIQKYGTDVVRWYFYTINPPGEPKRFDETDLGKVFRQFFLIFYNSYVFWQTYSKKSVKADLPPLKSLGILDRWIISRLQETILAVTSSLDKYGVGEAAKIIEEFVGDLSRWYIRRSRRRFQPERSGGKDASKDHENASRVLGYVIFTTSKLIAPFAPFFAEALYKTFGGHSVHLESWPETSKIHIDKKLMTLMKAARQAASVVLAKRAEAGIKVRQPLGVAKFKNPLFRGEKEILGLIKEEINVKEIIVEPSLKEDVWLGIAVTHELKEEGLFREMVRMVQDLRQDGKFEPQNKLIVAIEAPEELRYILQKYERIFLKEVNAVVLEYRRSTKFSIELDSKIEGAKIWIGLRKPL